MGRFRAPLIQTPLRLPLRKALHERHVWKTAPAILSRHTVALHSVALRFPGFGGVLQENRATPPQKGPVAPTFSALEGVSHFKLSLGRCRGTGGTLSPGALQWAT